MNGGLGAGILCEEEKIVSSLRPPKGRKGSKTVFHQIGEMAPKADVRPIEYEWVKNLYLEAKKRNIEFYFHQCGSMFLKDGVNIGKWNLKEQIKSAEEIQRELERI